MNTFETLREQVPLVQLVEPGKGGKAHCVAPGHQDNNPSMHVYEDHVHCYSCGFHGDVTDVWAKLRGFDRPIEAARDLAREYGVELPEQDSEAWRKAEERRRKEDLYLERARGCHRSLDRDPNVREWWEGRGFGEDLQERFLLGTTRDGTTAVIPFWHRGRVQGLIRRPLDGKPDKYLYPTTDEFVAGYRPLFIPGPLRGDVFLVEGIVDALAVAALREGAIAVGGTGISREQMRELERLPNHLYILPDADQEGEQAAREWARRLYPKARVCPPKYKEAAHA